MSESVAAKPRLFFISYTKVDEDFATFVARCIESKPGWEVRIQAWDFLPGSDFLEEMQKALDEADHVVPIFTPEYFESKYAKLEARAVWNEPGKVIPVIARELQVPSTFGQRVAIDLAGMGTEEQREVLLDKLDAAVRGARPRAALGHADVASTRQVRGGRAQTAVGRGGTERLREPGARRIPRAVAAATILGAVVVFSNDPNGTTSTAPTGTSVPTGASACSGSDTGVAAPALSSMGAVELAALIQDGESIGEGHVERAIDQALSGEEVRASAMLMLVWGRWAIDHGCYGAAKYQLQRAFRVMAPLSGEGNRHLRHCAGRALLEVKVWLNESDASEFADTLRATFSLRGGLVFDDRGRKASMPLRCPTVSTDSDAG